MGPAPGRRHNHAPAARAVAGAIRATLLLACIAPHPAGAAPTASPLPDAPGLPLPQEIRPSDWAYRTLIALAERQRCPAGQLQPLLAGDSAISRFEAAALVQACLSDLRPADAGPALPPTAGELQQLQALQIEFQRELRLLGQRVQAQEGRLDALTASSFSTTTTLSGSATFVLGANTFFGSADALATASRAAFGGTTLTSDLQLSLDTSFNGRDLLRAVLRQGNMLKSPFGGAGPTGGLSLLDVAYSPTCVRGLDCPYGVGIDRLFYQWPLARGLTAILGARVEQDDLFARRPSFYPTDSVLNLFTEAGIPAAFNKAIGPGAGLGWTLGRWSLSTSYVSSAGWLANPSLGGIGNGGSAGVGTVQLGYGTETWGLTALWSRIQGGFLLSAATPFTTLAIAGASHTDALGLSGSWQPARSGWLPSLNAGWGFNRSHEAPAVEGAVLSTSQSWMLGLQWKDALATGNTLGLAIGQPVVATALADGAAAQDGSLTAEAWYSIQVSDAISVAPAVFLLTRPLGRLTPEGSSYRQIGALLKTSFSF